MFLFSNELLMYSILSVVRMLIGVWYTCYSCGHATEKNFYIFSVIETWD